MHGIIFATWERYLTERFHRQMLSKYRQEMGTTPASGPLASRVYSDELLLAGVGAACRITGLPVETLLREFGSYFITNGLTRHLCAYLLTQIHCSRDLLLTMHDAHKQMGRIPDGITPPLFEYQVLPSDPRTLILFYDSPRKLCDVVFGAIQGSALLYGEHISINEKTCMKRGDVVCRFELRFTSPTSKHTEMPEEVRKRKEQLAFAQFILSLLPEEKGITLAELQTFLLAQGIPNRQVRPALLLEALRHLHHAGLVATSANHPGDNFTQRHYWRAPTSD